VVTPVFVRSLGAVDYGVWAVVIALSGTASTFDLGMTVALVRATPEHVARGRYDAIASLTLVASAFYAVLTAAGLLIAALVINFVPLAHSESTETMVISATAVFVSSNLAAIPRALLQGFNRFDATSAVTIAGYGVFWALGTALVSAGGGVRSLAIAMTLMFCVQAVGGAVILALAQPALWHALRSVRGVERSSLNYMFRFGGQMQISYVADIVKTNGPRLLAATLFGPVAAGMYDIGARIANAAWAIPAALLPAIVPAAAAASARDDQAELRALYVRGTRWLVLVALPIGVLFAASADLIIRTWIGPGYDPAVFVVACLALGNVLHLSTGAGTFVARGISRPDIEVRYQAFTLVLYIVLGATLPVVLGFAGIPLAVAVASVIGGVVFTSMFTQWLAIRRDLLMRALFLPIIATVAALVPLEIAATLVAGVPGPIQLAVMSATFAVTYVGILFASGVRAQGAQ
jgi:O-antigen/teichoic acid export membrane protein